MTVTTKAPVATARRRPDVNQLRLMAQGRWLEIFQALCPGMFDAAISNLGSHVTCPFHGGENDFRFVKRSTKKGRGNTADEGVALCTCGAYPDGFAVLKRATGLSFPDVLKMLDEHLNGSSPIPLPPRKSDKELAEEAAKRAAADAARDAEILSNINALWEVGRIFSSASLDSVPYYRNRGISAEVLQEVRDTRYIGSLGYWEEAGEGKDRKLVKRGSYPALLALMRDVNGNPVAIHRTWLTRDKADKAPVVKPKKLTMTPGAAGAAIRLYKVGDSETLGLSEGIETAHSARALVANGYFNDRGLQGLLPVWACYAERNIRSFQIPKALKGKLKRIVIFGDNDESGTGLAAATALKARMVVEHPEIEVIILLPQASGMDWNDVLCHAEYGN